MVTKPVVFGIVGVVLVVVVVVVWLIFFRGKMNLGDMVKKLIDVLLTPFKLILRIFGIGVGAKTPPIAAPPMETPPPTIDIVKHEIGTCPPCDVKCPDVPPAADCKPLELEVKYLKDMIRFVGSMAKRENAINAQYRELYPGFSVMTPEVRKMSYEYNFLKNQIRDDDSEWTYFKNYFTKLSGIPSASSAVHYADDIAF